jgi:hypothetical protein
MIEFMRGMFSAALKNNPFNKVGIIIVVLRIDKESSFPSVDNLKVYSILI